MQSLITELFLYFLPFERKKAEVSDVGCKRMKWEWLEKKESRHGESRTAFLGLMLILQMFYSTVA